MILKNLRSTISFDIKQLDENNFYILNGIMLYVSSINNDMKNIGDKSRNRGRTKII